MSFAVFFLFSILVLFIEATSLSVVISAACVCQDMWLMVVD